MNEYTDSVIGAVSTGVAGLMTASQVNEIFRAIQLALTIICAVLTIVSICYNWYKGAKADGKITGDEIQDLVDQIKEPVENLKDELTDEDKGEE